MLQPFQHLGKLLPFDRFEHIAHRAARQRRMRMVGHRYAMHWNMPRIDVALQPVEHGQPAMVGQPHVQDDRLRHKLARQRHALVRAFGQQALEIQFARQVAQYAGEGRIILDKQDDAAVAGQGVPIILDRPDARRWRWQVGAGRQQRGRLARRGPIMRTGDGRLGEMAWQRERKATPLPRRAHQADLATQQFRQFARYGQAQPGAAIFPADRSIGLPEGFKDGLLLLDRNADARVMDGKGNGVVPSLLHRQRDFALVGEFDGVRQEILEDLLHPMRVALNLDRHGAGRWDTQRNPLLPRARFQQSMQLLDHRRDAHIPCL